MLEERVETEEEEGNSFRGSERNTNEKELVVFEREPVEPVRVSKLPTRCVFCGFRCIFCGHYGGT